jgi:hypothetical protein
VLHAGDGVVDCRVRTGSDADALAAARSALFRDFPGRGRAGWSSALDREFGGASYGTGDVFPDERRRLLARRAERALETTADVDGRGETQSRELLEELRTVERPVPVALAGLASRLVSRSVGDELRRLAGGGPVLPGVDRVRALIARTQSLGIALDLRSEEAALAIQAALERRLEGLGPGASVKTVDDALALLALGTVLEAPPDLWAAQNAATRVWRDAPQPGREVLAPLMAALGFAPAAPAPARERRRG